MPAAAIYVRPAGTFVFSSHVTETGLGVTGEPKLAVAAGADASELGNAVLHCMSESREGIPNPADADEHRENWKSLLRFMKCSSNAALERESIHISAYIDQTSVILTPYRTARTRGFDALPWESVTCPLDAAQIGTEILALRDKSRAGMFNPAISKPPPEPPREPEPEVHLRKGDRVQDTWGNKATIKKVKPPSKRDPLGMITAKFDDGRRRMLAYVAHDLKKLDE